MSASRQPIVEPIGEFSNVELSEVCTFCIHYRPKDGRSCTAFPYIPDRIWFGYDDHTSPYPGDKGIRYSSATLSDSVLS